MGCSVPTAQKYMDDLLVEMKCERFYLQKPDIGQKIAKYWEVKWLREIQKISRQYLAGDTLNIRNERLRILKARADARGREVCSSNPE